MLPYKFKESLFKKIPIIGILRGYTEVEVLSIIQIYKEVGFTNIEVTMNTPTALPILQAVNEQFGDDLNVGMGTVCSLEETKKAIAAGAQFIVSPITNEASIALCKEQGVPIFPGAFSPSEIYHAWQLGAKMVKVFPSGLLGPIFIKEVLAPMNDIALMPTGGVNLTNIMEYHTAGAKAFGVASLLFDKQLIQAKQWLELKHKMQVVRNKLAFLG